MSIRPKAISTGRTRPGPSTITTSFHAGAQYGPIIIAYRNGAPVRIRDVATVIDGAENTKLAAWVNERPAIVLNIQRQPGTNIISVVDTVQSLLPRSRHPSRKASRSA